MQITNIQFSEDELGAYWTGILINGGAPAGVIGTFYDLDETGTKRLSREDQIVGLLFSGEVVDPAYRTTLIYDGACRFCRKTAQWVRGLDKKRLLRITWRKESRDFLGQDFYVFNALHKNPLHGIYAATEVCELVLGPGNWIAQIMRVRPVKCLFWRVHYWVMANRGWLIRFWNSDEAVDESVREC